jgi:hypothetical protein
MKRNNIIKGVIALSVFSLVGAGIAGAQAASNGSGGVMDMFGGWGRNDKKIEQRVELTDAQKAARDAQIKAINTALENGDYTAWVTAVKAENANSPLLKKVTADNFNDYATAYKQREVKMTEQKTKNDAVKTALNAGDYTAWVTAIKAVDANSPLLTKITADNFSKYLEANKLREQADTILKDLGVTNSGFMGGPRMDDRGHGSPMEMDK